MSTPNSPILNGRLDGLDLNQVVPDKTLARRNSLPRNDVALTTFTYYGFALCGYWGQLRSRNGYPCRYIARQDGVSVWLYSRWPNKQEDTDQVLYFGSGAVVQFKAAPDPVDAVEVVFRQESANSPVTRKVPIDPERSNDCPGSNSIQQGHLNMSCTSIHPQRPTPDDGLPRCPGFHNLADCI
jgi:hypothetical protein